MNSYSQNKTTFTVNNVEDYPFIHNPTIDDIQGSLFSKKDGLFFSDKPFDEFEMLTVFTNLELSQQQSDYQIKRLYVCDQKNLVKNSFEDWISKAGISDVSIQEDLEIAQWLTVILTDLKEYNILCSNNFTVEKTVYGEWSKVFSLSLYDKSSVMYNFNMIDFLISLPPEVQDYLGVSANILNV